MIEILCLRCKRKLTNPVSRSRHYGPVCWKKIRPDPKMRKLEDVYGVE